MSTATTMQAVICRNGAPVCARVPVPEPGPDEVLVKVQACALNRADLAMAAGAKHGALGGEGAVLGMEWSGVVVRTGARVPSLRPGQRVMGSDTPLPTAVACCPCQRAAMIRDRPPACRSRCKPCTMRW
ncbi:alcohol dehydrogenase catalytic domain-containing protein [Cupriavidus cauae]|uniref:alcohol dehydrogenase catalytic domain-containing protein n=1 Tax=Cupriavidus cauae TaxID=2608999 RepID=UPI0022440230|nr:alcohol dehydrogenase catalytic domain-containing protein [Cupriavidus cauae]UZN51582.1 alcohol dehydrogenase catalytic domain-containing protein [Cupriavidus cauae]